MKKYIKIYAFGYEKVTLYQDVTHTVKSLWIVQGTQNPNSQNPRNPRIASRSTRIKKMYPETWETQKLYYETPQIHKIASRIRETQKLHYKTRDI